MPPALGDHEARRLAVSEAVWRVLADRGFGVLRLRAVAAEMGASTGLLTHYFPTKRALLVYAMDLLDQRNEARRREADPGDQAAPGSDPALQPPRHRDQQLIPHVVAEGVVDRGEAVQVQVADADAAGGRCGSGG